MESLFFVTCHEGSLFPVCRRLRFAVFVKEQGFSRSGELDGLDKVARHLVLWYRRRPVATARLFLENGVYHIGRVCVDARFRGLGLGKRLMEAAEAKVLALGGNVLTLSAQVQALPFYEKCGYKPYGPIYPDEGCPHRAMEKRL